MSAHQDPPGFRPYPETAQDLLAAGWAPLPLPEGAKFPPPDGWTGKGAPWPSGADVAEWVATSPQANTAARLPAEVIGVDVDAYADKRGGESFDKMTAQAGVALPQTVVVTSRDDGTSGIRLLRVPAGVDSTGLREDHRRWPEVDLIRSTHRYAVAPGSRHPSGGIYLARDERTGTVLETLPPVDTLPELPAEWVALLTPEPEAEAAGEPWTPGHEATEEAQAWALALLQRQARAVADTAEGGRNAALNNAALVVGHYAPHLIAPDTVTMTLRAAADLAGLEEGEAKATIASGLAAGMKDPQAAPLLQDASTVLGAPAFPRGNPSGRFGRLEPSWFATTLPGNYEGMPDDGLPVTGDPCGVMDEAVSKWSADPVAGVEAVVRLGLEGHRGAHRAMQYLGDAYLAAGGGADEFAQAVREVVAAARESGASRPPEECSCPEPEPAKAQEPDGVNTWAPVDLGPILDGTLEVLVPTVLAREDGPAMLYAGRDHNLVGETESAKTWLALAAVAEVLGAGGSVVYLDFEDRPETFVGRLVTLGIDLEVIRERFHYVHPEVPASALNVAPLSPLLRGAGLVVLDGVSDGMGLHGLSPLETADVIAWRANIVAAIGRAAAGAPVVMLDHVVKSREAQGRYALGSQHKVGGLTGAHFMLRLAEPVAPGRVGRVEVWVGKDRPGQVRATACGPMDKDRMQLWAVFVLDSTGDPIRTRLEVPLVSPAGPGGDDRLASLGEAILANLVPGAWLSGNKAIAGVTGRRQDKIDALEFMVAAGRCRRRPVYGKDGVTVLSWQYAPPEGLPCAVCGEILPIGGGADHECRGADS